MSVLKIKREDGTWESISGGSSSSVDLDDTLTQSGKAADAKVVGDKFDDLVDIIVQADEPVGAEDGTLWLDLDEESVGGSGGGSSYEIPTFDLTEMGLPNIPLDGTEVTVSVDCTTFREALAAGSVKVIAAVHDSGVTITFIGNGAHNGWNDAYVLSGILPMDVLYAYDISVYEGCIDARIYTLQTALPDAEEATF